MYIKFSFLILATLVIPNHAMLTQQFAQCSTQTLTCTWIANITSTLHNFDPEKNLTKNLNFYEQIYYAPGMQPTLKSSIALHEAAQTGNEEAIIRLLKRHKANIWELNEQGLTAFEIAYDHGQFHLLPYLKGPSISKEEKLASEKLNAYTKKEKSYKILWLMLARDFTTDGPLITNKPDPERYISNRDTILKLIPQADLSINYQGYTILHHAVMLNDLECIALILKYGGFINALSSEKKPPLFYTKKPVVFKLLELHGADLTITVEGKSIAHSAMAIDYPVEIVQLITAHKVIKGIHPCLAVDSEGNSPWHALGQSARDCLLNKIITLQEKAELLLTCNPHITQPNNKNETIELVIENCYNNAIKKAAFPV